MRCTAHNLKVNIYADGTVLHVSRFTSDAHHMTPCNSDTMATATHVFTSTMVARNGHTFREWSTVD